MAGDLTSADSDAITLVTLCSGEIRLSKEPWLPIFFVPVFISGIEFNFQNGYQNSLISNVKEERIAGLIKHVHSTEAQTPPTPDSPSLVIIQVIVRATTAHFILC